MKMKIETYKGKGKQEKKSVESSNLEDVEDQNQDMANGLKKNLKNGQC